MKRLLFCMVGVCGLLACSETSDETADLASTDYANTAPDTPPPTGYDAKDGKIYHYTSAVSEDDAKAGKAVGDVISYRYLGEKDGVHTLAALDANDNIVARQSCSNPCKIINTRIGSERSRNGFSETSVVGAAFTDAFRGYLEVSEDPN